MNAAIRAADDCASEGGSFIARRGKKKRHLALDIESTVASGADVMAVGEGKVTLTGNWPNLGKLVIVEHAGGHYSLYGHLGKVEVKTGQSVAAGQLLGTIGFSGNASCLQEKGLQPHVHFAVYRGFSNEAAAPRRLARWLAYREEMIARHGESKAWGPLDPSPWLRSQSCIE